jgi:hypothetical protein
MTKTIHIETDIVLCIPRMESSIPRSKIFETFSKHKIGFIDRIYEIPLKNEELCKKVVIKFRTWVKNPTSDFILERLNSNRDFKIVYSDPWYWVVTKYEAK